MGRFRIRLALQERFHAGSLVLAAPLSCSRGNSGTCAALHAPTPLTSTTRACRGQHHRPWQLRGWNSFRSECVTARADAPRAGRQLQLLADEPQPSSNREQCRIYVLKPGSSQLPTAPPRCSSGVHKSEAAAGNEAQCATAVLVVASTWKCCEPPPLTCCRRPGSRPSWRRRLWPRRR